MRSRNFNFGLSRRPPLPARGQTQMPLIAAMVRTCRKCGCTEADCQQCIARTGRPCYWVSADLCSACLEPIEVAA